MPLIGCRKMSKKDQSPVIVSFVGQKGGVGKSALARLVAVGAAHRELNVLLADFDLEQLTCVSWNAKRLQSGVLPDIDVRAFKSLKKLVAAAKGFDLVVVDTRGLADNFTTEIVEESDLIFLPTGASFDDLDPTLALAKALRKKGTRRKIVLIFSKIGKSERQFSVAAASVEEAGHEILGETWPYRDGFQADLDAGRAGREAWNRYLRDAAIELENAIFERIGI